MFTESRSSPRKEQAIRVARRPCSRHATLRSTPCPIRFIHRSVYLLEGDIDTASLERIAHELLCHPVTEAVVIGARPLRAKSMIEVHPLPGVTDPDAEAVELAIRSLVGCDVRVRTGRRYDVGGLDAESARQFASRCLANPLIHGVYTEPYHPDAFPEGHVQEFEVRTLPLRTMDDELAGIALTRCPPVPEPGGDAGDPRCLRGHGSRSSRDRVGDLWHRPGRNIACTRRSRLA